MDTWRYEKDRVALTPPMGWNSWDCYAATVTEDQLLANAHYMQKHLLPHGWSYIVCDIQWYEPLAGQGDTEYRPLAGLCMDAYGRLLPAENRFPSSAGGKGFAPIADQIHAMGLKFGLHIMRGIPRQAAHARTPVLGTDTTADQIANPFSISKWNGDMYGVDASKPGAQAYYDSLFALYAQWGVDYIKVDDIGNTNLYPDNPYSGMAEIEMIRRAIDRSGRPMVLSLSPGPAPVDRAWHLRKHANLWRITDDFWDHWPLLLDMFTRCERWQAHVGPGSWPDCDMLPLGHIGMGHKRPRMTNFTQDEQRTLMTLWSIFRSPLMMGGELNDNDAWTLSLLTNDEVLAVNQRGNAPMQLHRDNRSAAWISRAGEDAVNVALFNLGEEATAVSADLAEAFGHPFAARDLWQGLDMGTGRGRITVELAPHGAALYRLTRA